MTTQLEHLITDYRKDLDVWVCRWFDFINSEHLRQCYTFIFEEAKRQNIHY